MIPTKGISPQYLKEVFFRRFWYVFLTFFLISLSALLYCIYAPRMFLATTTILVEPQRVPGHFVRSTVTLDLQGRLRTIIQQIKSRSRLEKIMMDYDLYAGTRASGTMSDAIELFRQNIDVRVRGGRSAFEVSFQDKDPVKTRDVTNTIAGLFIEDNLNLREAQAANTTRFLDVEINRLHDVLQDRETAIREFKQKHRGYLPEDMSRNRTMMGHLQGQLDSINNTIQQTKDRKILLDNQLNNLRRMETELSTLEGNGGDLFGIGSSGSETVWEPANLQRLRSQLEELQIRYSDLHPDVIRTKAMISKLEQEASSYRDPSEGVEDSGEYSLFFGQIEELAAQLEMADRELAALTRESRETQNKLADYRNRIEAGPKIAQMLEDLSRGYGEINSNYRDLVDKKFKAELAENLEIAQQAEQFTILDFAKLPDKPFSPRTRRILLYAFLLAVGGGFGLAFLVEALDRRFFGINELEDTLQIPSLVSIPFILTDKDRQRFVVTRAASIVVCVLLTSVLLYSLYYLWLMDPTALAFQAARS